MKERVVNLFNLTFRSGDVALTAEISRSRQRYARAILTSGSAVLARIINIATGLISVPLTLHYLGEDRFGLWMSVTSFVAFMSFADLGLGIGLQNTLSICDGNDDKVEPKGLISSALFAALVMFVLLVLVSLWLLPLLPLDQLISTTSLTAKQDLLPTTQAVMITFGIGLPCTLIQRIYVAYQIGYGANIVLAIGRVLGLAGILMCIYLKLSLPFLAACMMGLPFLTLALGGIILFKRNRWLSPSLRAIRLTHLKNITRIGILGFGAQVAYVLIVSGPVLLIANCLGTSAVTPYAVTQRLLSVAGIILVVSLDPLWPAYCEAAARGDMEWVRRTFKRSMVFGTSIMIPIFIVCALVGRKVILLWTGEPKAVPSFSLLMACNVCALVMAWDRICSILLNGLNRMAGQATYGVLAGIFALTAGWLGIGGASLSQRIWVVVIISMLCRSTWLGIEVCYVLNKRKTLSISGTSKT